MTRPIIGVTIDNCESRSASGRYESNIAYSRMLTQAGALPVLLPQEIELAALYVARCDGLMLTGGDDARSADFGVPPHPESRCIDPRRQAFELALLDALAQRPDRPVLGVCLGMQLMSLHAGGRMHQHLPEILAAETEEHQHNQRHAIVVEARTSVLCSAPSDEPAACSPPDLLSETVVSSHHQAVTDAGRLHVVARSPHGVIEAVDDPLRPFYLGVQWHPERAEGLFNLELIRRFVAHCARLGPSPNS